MLSIGLLSFNTSNGLDVKLNCNSAFLIRADLKQQLNSQSDGFYFELCKNIETVNAFAGLQWWKEIFRTNFSAASSLLFSKFYKVRFRFLGVFWEFDF